MSQPQSTRRYRFGVFDVDSATGELRRQGLRVRLHTQPFQLLLLLLDRSGQPISREEIVRELWPDGTFVDFDHSVNSAINRLREALGDKAANPRFIETLARRGYRFIAPIERVEDAAQSNSSSGEPHESIGHIEPQSNDSGGGDEYSGGFSSLLASPADLPSASPFVVRSIYLSLQLMYLGFYVGALANLAEIQDLLSPLPGASLIFWILVLTATILIPARVFMLCATLFHAPGLRRKLLRLWWLLLPFDLLWSLSPFLLLHHIPWGLALACMPLLIYSPFAQRSLILMRAASEQNSAAAISQ